MQNETPSVRGSRFSQADLWSGLAGTALGVFVTWSGIKLGIGRISDPGSGFVLFYTGLLMCAFAFAITIAALMEDGPRLGEQWSTARWTKPLAVIGCLIAFSIALEPLGFLLSSIPLMLLLLRVIDPVRWALAVPIAALAPLGMWWVLKHALAIQLPIGVFNIG
jgi:putative tricarboxylic transport membrane protein